MHYPNAWAGFLSCMPQAHHQVTIQMATGAHVVWECSLGLPHTEAFLHSTKWRVPLDIDRNVQTFVERILDNDVYPAVDTGIVDHVSAVERLKTKQCLTYGLPHDALLTSLPIDTATNMVQRDSRDDLQEPHDSLVMHLCKSAGSQVDEFIQTVSIPVTQRERRVLIGTAAVGLGKTHLAYAASKKVVSIIVPVIVIRRFRSPLPSGRSSCSA
jgi:hypothetical protein